MPICSLSKRSLLPSLTVLHIAANTYLKSNLNFVRDHAKLCQHAFFAFLGPPTHYVSINSTVNQQKLSFSDPTHILCFYVLEKKLEQNWIKITLLIISCDKISFKSNFRFIGPIVRVGCSTKVVIGRLVNMHTREFKPWKNQNENKNEKVLWITDIPSKYYLVKSVKMVPGRQMKRRYSLRNVR